MARAGRCELATWGSGAGVLATAKGIGRGLFGGFGVESRTMWVDLRICG